MSSNSDKLFKGVSVQTIVTITFGVLEIVVFSIMSRLLSKIDFGYYAALSGIMAIFMSISEAGLGASVIQKKDASQRYISTAFTLSCIIGFTMTLLLLLLSPFLATLVADSFLKLPLQVMALNIFMYGVISIGNGILYRNLEFKTIGLINIIAYILASIVCVTMAYNNCGIFSIVMLYVIHSFLKIIFIFSKVKIPALGLNREDSKSIFSFGGWLTAGVILNNITAQLDKLLLPKWLSVESLGAYNRPAGFVSSVSDKINGIFDTVLFPILSSMQENKDRIKEVFIQSVSLLNSFSIILASIFFFNANLIVSIFFGKSWTDIVPLMQVISFSVIFMVNGRLVDCFFRSLAFVKIGFFLRLISVFVTFFSIYIGSHYDIYGVAISIVLASIINILTKVFVLSLKISLTPLKVLWNMIKAWKTVFPVLLIGIPFVLFNVHTWIIDITFSILFLIVILIEFAFFPQFVGIEYTMSVYPKINSIKNKIFKNKL